MKQTILNYHNTIAGFFLLFGAIVVSLCAWLALVTWDHGLLLLRLFAGYALGIITLFVLEYIIESIDE